MGELKSAWELALEKSKKMGGEEPVSLSSNQRDEIAEAQGVFTPSRFGLSRYFRGWLCKE
jgi:hypothetical protein